jgi:hypothetical protein
MQQCPHICFLIVQQISICSLMKIYEFMALISQFWSNSAWLWFRAHTFGSGFPSTGAQFHSLCAFASWLWHVLQYRTSAPASLAHSWCGGMTPHASWGNTEGYEIELYEYVSFWYHVDVFLVNVNVLLYFLFDFCLFFPLWSGLVYQGVMLFVRHLASIPRQSVYL